MIRPRLILLGCCLTMTALAGEKPATTSTGFAEHLIADGYGYSFGVAAVDFDKDGHLDVTSGDTIKNALYWYQNDGKGNFKRHSIQENEPGWFERHAIGDLNGDGEQDLVIVKNLDGHLVWFENRGKPLQPDNWVRHVLTTDLKRAYDVAVVDLDGDGKLDVAASAWNGNHIAWFPNPGGQAINSEWKKEMIDPDLGEARTIRVADFNRDGKPDLLSTGRLANVTAWYEKTTDPAHPWKRHVIDDKSAQPVHGEPADMDGDGDLDVVMGLGMLAAIDDPLSNEVAWYENVGNPGQGTEWKKHLVTKLPFGFEAIAADLDGDKDMDLVATAWGGPGGIVWLENTGDPKSGWRQHSLKQPWIRANQAIVADLNGDDRLDIIACAEKGSNEVRWWENLIKPAKAK